MTIYSATYENLAKIDQQVRIAAIAAGLSEDDAYSVELAVDEACTNIIDHSYGGEGLGEIDCVCQTLADGLKIIIYDTGCFFNPEGIPAPDVHKPVNNRPEGGLGLFFMRSLMDEIIFDPCKGSGTSLTMIKRKHTSKRG
jgi:serine/threonine-protein kinase RsbW